MAALFFTLPYAADAGLGASWGVGPFSISYDFGTGDFDVRIGHAIQTPIGTFEIGYSPQVEGRTLQVIGPDNRVRFYPIGGQKIVLSVADAVITIDAKGNVIVDLRKASVSATTAMQSETLTRVDVREQECIARLQIVYMLGDYDIERRLPVGQPPTKFANDAWTQDCPGEYWLPREGILCGRFDFDNDGRKSGWCVPYDGNTWQRVR